MKTSSKYVDLKSDTMILDPLPVLKQLRDECPVSKVKVQLTGKEGYLLTRYEDVVAMYKSPHFSTDISKQPGFFIIKMLPKVFRLLMASMVFKDDADHRRLRTLVDRAFTPKMIKTLGATMDGIATSLLDNMEERAGKGEVVDLVQDFALPFPLTVISEMLGVPEGDRATFHQQVHQFIELSSQGIPGLFRAYPAANSMMKLFERLVTLRRKVPDDRLITALVSMLDGDEDISEFEILAMIYLLLLAGHETTTTTLSTSTLELIEHPEQLALLYENPELIDSAVEEFVRYSSPTISGAPRFAKQDVEINGHQIEKGASVIGMLSSANFDERVFLNPEKFDITREPNRHVSFGSGVHICLGMWLARMETKVAMNLLIQRFPEMRLAIPREQLSWKVHDSLRGLKTLPLILRPN